MQNIVAWVRGRVHLMKCKRYLKEHQEALIRLEKIHNNERLSNCFKL